MPGMGLLRRGVVLLRRVAGLLRKGAWCLGLLWCWQKEEVSSDVTLCRLELVGCFCFRLSNCRCDLVDPCRLHIGLEVKASEQRELEHASVEIVELLAGLVEGDDGWFKLGFALLFLVCRIDAMKIRVS